MTKKVMFGDIGVRPLDTAVDFEHEVNFGRRKYRFSATPFKKGEFSTLHRGVDQNGKQVLLKIAKSEKTNAALDKELRIIEHFKDQKKLQAVGRYLPKIIDTLKVDGRLVVVMPYNPDRLSVETIVDAHDGVLDPRDAAWVARRVMAQVVAAEMADLVHGSILPPHVILNRASHNPLHIGWAHAVDPRTAKIERVISDWRDFYPPEVFEKKKPDVRTDIYMAGKTIVYMLGGDVSTGELPDAVPEKLQEVVHKCTEENRHNRYQGGREALEGLTKAITSLWGKEFRELEV